MKRILDIFLSVFLMIIFLLPMLLILILLRITSKDSILYWSCRIGKGNEMFYMPKFRTMRADAPLLATHLLINSNSYITPIGSFLRKSSLDELPQLWSIFVGHMSFVGPRPALFNQLDLIKLRTESGVQILVPGLTGWAQINGRDELSISEKVVLDKYYLENRSFLMDLQIMIVTVFKVIRRNGVKH